MSFSPSDPQLEAAEAKIKDLTSKLMTLMQLQKAQMTQNADIQSKFKEKLADQKAKLKKVARTSALYKFQLEASRTELEHLTESSQREIKSKSTTITTLQDRNSLLHRQLSELRIGHLDDAAREKEHAEAYQSLFEENQVITQALDELKATQDQERKELSLISKKLIQVATERDAVKKDYTKLLGEYREAQAQIRASTQQVHAVLLSSSAYYYYCYYYCYWCCHSLTPLNVTISFLFHASNQDELFASELIRVIRVI